jgi:hypothetical protein
MPVDLGTGASVTFGTSGFTANYTELRLPGMSRPVIKTSHLGTTTADTFTPGDLVDFGEFEMDLQWDPDDFPPIDQVAETITLTFPLSSGGSTAAKFQFTGFAHNFSGAVPHEELMTGSLTVKISGDITDTDES